MVMSSKSKGKRLALLSGVLAVAVAAWPIGNEVLIWFKFREDFESLGEGMYKHLETGVVFTRVDEFLISESQFFVALPGRSSSCRVFWPARENRAMELRDWQDIFKDPGFSIPTEKQWERAKQAGYNGVLEGERVRFLYPLVYNLR